MTRIFAALVTCLPAWSAAILGGWNLAGFVVAQSGYPLGNAPRFVGTSRWGGVVRENVTVQKRFYVFRESVSVNLRCEVYNLGNQKTWNSPQSLDLTNQQFGKVTGAFGTRSMQFGAKLQW